MVKVSVVMPVYNTKEEYLRTAIQSVLDQTFTDFELLIVNDGSYFFYIDDIVASYNDTRIKYLKYATNRGAAYARNFAISKATGEYIAFLDSDDISLPSRLERQVEFLDSHGSIGCVGTKIKFIGHKRSIPYTKILKHREIEERLLFSGCVFWQSSVMLRKSLFDQLHIHYRDEYVPSEDYALWLDLIGNTKFEVIDEILTFYRNHKDNVSHTAHTKQRITSIKAQIDTLKRIGKMKDFNADVWFKFFFKQTLSKKELNTLGQEFDGFVSTFVKKGYSESFIKQCIQRRFKRQYYNTKTLRGQLDLWKSPLNRDLKIGSLFRFMCLIIRGVF